MPQTNLSDIVGYYAEQQISTPWRGFLTALAQEFEAQLDAVQLRQLMAQVGERFAAAHPIGSCPNLEALCATLNVIWREMSWGFVDLTETAEHLAISHYCAPLGAFGADSASWLSGFFEGAYRHWLRVLGASNGLVLIQADGEPPLRLEYRLVNERKHSQR